MLLTVLILLHPQMLSCLEHMYHDLGLVRDFSINPITLKRWLVSVRPCWPLSAVPSHFPGMHRGYHPLGLGFLLTKATLLGESCGDPSPTRHSLLLSFCL